MINSLKIYLSVNSVTVYIDRSKFVEDVLNFAAEDSFDPSKRLKVRANILKNCIYTCAG